METNGREGTVAGGGGGGGVDGDNIMTKMNERGQRRVALVDHRTADSMSRTRWLVWAALSAALCHGGC